mmetsp:Transcript_137351/g.274065  ORF Transcript_137351/g.274065 Transcript_137351/m.274065 type:complete len:612 (-) Transcript_137351:279-2114(-)
MGCVPAPMCGEPERFGGEGEECSLSRTWVPTLPTIHSTLKAEAVPTPPYAVPVSKEPAPKTRTQPRHLGLAALPDSTLFNSFEALDLRSLLCSAAVARTLKALARADPLWVKQPRRLGVSIWSPESLLNQDSQVVVAAGFVRFLRQAQRDMQVRRLLRTLDNTDASANISEAVSRQLVARGPEALDAVIRERALLREPVAVSCAGAVERRLCDVWAAGAWKELLASCMSEQICLEQGVMIFSLWDDPNGCQPAVLRAELSALAAAVERRLVCVSGKSSRSYRHNVTDIAQAVSHTIFVERGLRGPLASYLEQKSTLLSHLLRRGVGVSMSLSLLYVAVARRVGLSCGVVAAIPSQVLVRVHGAGPCGEDGFVDALTGGVLMNVADMHGPVGQLIRHACMQTSTPAVVFGRMLANAARVFEATLRRDPQQSETAWRLFGIYEQLLPLSPGSSAVPIKLKRVNLALRFPGDVLRQDAAMKDVNDVHELWEEAGDAQADPQPFESETDNDDNTEDSPRGLERSTEHDMLRDRSFRWSSPSSIVALSALAALLLLGGLVPKLPTRAGAPFEFSRGWPNLLARSNTLPQTYWRLQTPATGSEVWSESQQRRTGHRT